MGGRRTSKEEMQQIKTFIEEGLTNREIAEKLGRSEAGIRNLRYRKSLVKKAEDESKVLFQQRDELKRIVRILKGQKTSLTNEVTGLRKEKEKLEAIINSDKNELQEVLAQALMNLKQKRPDLFILTGQDQMVSLVQLFLGVITE
jgi:IS30 family transposase